MKKYSIEVIDSNGREWTGLQSDHDSIQSAEKAFDLALTDAKNQELHNRQTVDVSIRENDEEGNSFTIKSVTIQK